MTLAYAKKLGLWTWKTNIKAQKIDGFSVKKQSQGKSADHQSL